VLVYDTGALLAAHRRDKTIFLLHEQALIGGVFPVVHSVVIAQAWRHGPAHNLSRLLKGCQVVEDLPEPNARAAGELCARTGTSDIVDAVVVLLARQIRAGMVVTSDPADVEILRDAAAATFTIRPI
jgi:hypothetical protein